jgi:hypothetical protein
MAVRLVAPLLYPYCDYSFSSCFSLDSFSFFSASSLPSFFCSSVTPPPQPVMTTPDTLTDRARRNAPINSLNRLALLKPLSFLPLSTLEGPGRGPGPLPELPTR